MRWLGRWFWSPIRDGENWAQTLVRVIGNLLRSALTILLLLIALGAGGISAFSYYSGEASERERAKLVVTVNHRDQNRFAKDTCGADYPIVVYVRNETDKALTSMDIELIGRERGSSTNKLDYHHQKIDWDIVVPPGHAISMCYTLPEKYAGLMIDGGAVSYSVTLVKPEPWMVRETQAHRIDPKTGL